MKKTNLQKGISLVETIIYIAIFSLFVTGLSQFSTILSGMRSHTQAVLEVNDQGSQAIKLITQTLRSASETNSPSIGNSDVGLSVETNTPSTSPTIFSLDEGVLYIQEGSGSPVALTNNKVNVSDLNFSNLSRANTPNIIKVSFTITNVSLKDPYSVSFEGSGALRK